MKSCWKETIKSFPSRSVKLIQADQSIEEAILMIQKNRVLVVQEDKKTIGVCSETDIINKFLGSSISKNEPVRAIMSKGKTVFVSVNTIISDALMQLKEKKSQYLIIAEGSDLLGIVTVKDILIFFSEYYPQDVLNLPPDASITSVEPAGA